MHILQLAKHFHILCLIWASQRTHDYSGPGSYSEAWAVKLHTQGLPGKGPDQVS